jgi:hypothetical protein
MGLKIIESYDASFVLEPDAKTALSALLTGESFLQQLAVQLQCSRIEFCRVIFSARPLQQRDAEGNAC